jgi:urease accessory protein UreF
VHSKGIETVLHKVAVRGRREVPTATTFTTWVKAKVKRTWSRNSTKKKVGVYYA